MTKNGKRAKRFSSGRKDHELNSFTSTHHCRLAGVLCAHFSRKNDDEMRRMKQGEQRGNALINVKAPNDDESRVLFRVCRRERAIRIGRFASLSHELCEARSFVLTMPSPSCRGQFIAVKMPFYRRKFSASFIAARTSPLVRLAIVVSPINGHEKAKIFPL